MSHDVERLYREYYSFTVDRARYFAQGTGVEAEDLASEAWIRVLRRIDELTFDPQRFASQFRGYVRAALRSAAVDAARHLRRQPVTTDERAAATAAAPADDPDAALRLRDLQRQAPGRARRTLEYLLDPRTAERARAAKTSEIRVIARDEQVSPASIYSDIKILRAILAR